MLDAYVEQVETRIGERSFEEVEAFIDTLPLSDDEKAALWLIAWSELPRRERRVMVLSG